MSDCCLPKGEEAAAGGLLGHPPVELLVLHGQPLVLPGLSVNLTTASSIQSCGGFQKNIFRV